MRFQYGEIDTESKQLWSEAYDLLLAKSIRTKREDIFRRIYFGEMIIPQEMLLLSKYDDLILVGRPDAIVFDRAMPILLFEYKFSKSSIPYRSYQVQAKIYGKILEGMGFNVSKLHYAIAIVPPALRHDQELSKKIFEAVIKNGFKETKIEVEEATIHVFRYLSESAEEEIDWALDLWKGIREAIPTQNPNKCKSCEYLNECSSSVKL